MFWLYPCSKGKGERLDRRRAANRRDTLVHPAGIITARPPPFFGGGLLFRTEYPFRVRVRSRFSVPVYELMDSVSEEDEVSGP